MDNRGQRSPFGRNRKEGRKKRERIRKNLERIWKNLEMFGVGPRPAQYRLRLMSNADEASSSHGDAVRSAPLLLLALSALGVVFGDLGTSPLYALQEAFHGARGVA